MTHFAGSLCAFLRLWCPAPKGYKFPRVLAFLLPYRFYELSSFEALFSPFFAFFSNGAGPPRSFVGLFFCRPSETGTPCEEGLFSRRFLVFFFRGLPAGLRRFSPGSFPLYFFASGWSACVMVWFSRRSTGGTIQVRGPCQFFPFFVSTRPGVLFCVWIFYFRGPCPRARAFLFFVLGGRLKPFFPFPTVLPSTGNPPPLWVSVQARRLWFFLPSLGTVFPSARFLPPLHWQRLSGFFVADSGR